jgi:hypothetical protein
MKGTTETILKQLPPEIVQVRGYTLLQAYTLSELDRLLRLKATYEKQSTHDRFLYRVLCRALHTMYLDCLELGLEQEAKALMVARKEHDQTQV